MSPPEIARPSVLVPPAVKASSESSSGAVRTVPAITGFVLVIVGQRRAERLCGQARAR